MRLHYRSLAVVSSFDYPETKSPAVWRKVSPPFGPDPVVTERGTYGIYGLFKGIVRNHKGLWTNTKDWKYPLNI